MFLAFIFQSACWQAPTTQSIQFHPSSCLFCVISRFHLALNFLLFVLWNRSPQCHFYLFVLSILNFLNCNKLFIFLCRIDCSSLGGPEEQFFTFLSFPSQIQLLSFTVTIHKICLRIWRGLMKFFSYITTNGTYSVHTHSVHVSIWGIVRLFFPAYFMLED